MIEAVGTVRVWPSAPRRNVQVRCSTAVLVWLAAGCAGAPPPAADQRSPVPVVLLGVDTLSADMRLRQHVTARWADEEGEFDAVVEKRPGVLQIVGLTPIGTVAFSVRHDAAGVHFENRSDREVPFPPEHIVADVQRAFYPWLQQPPDCDNCERHSERLGMKVTERFAQGKLIERSFQLLDAPAREPLTVRYLSWRNRQPAEIVIHNPWHQYELSVRLSELEQP